MLRLIPVMLLLLVVLACSPDSAGPFVGVEGTRFVLDGEPYVFVGTNLWYGMYLGAEGELGNRDRLLRELDLLKELGVTNLRICAASEKADFEYAVRPALQTAPGIYNETLLDGLDFCMAEVAKRDMKAVLYLTNYWEWSGGMSAYNHWSGEGPVVDPLRTFANWVDYNGYVTRFYAGEKQNQMYRDHIKFIIERVNPYTGVAYRDEPAIMAWQLANEPRPGAGDIIDEVAPEWVNWIDQTAAYIKSLDPNHLVSTGNEGVMGSGGSEEYFLQAHAGPNIDYATFHIWAKNWSWYDAENAEETYPVAEQNAVDYFEKHLQLAAELGKPITLEEFGLGRDEESYDPESTTIYRDRYLKAIFEQVEAGVAAGKPIAGTNFWAWGGFGIAKQADYYWQPGDPFTGDPPQEPQGLNSVYAADSTTLDILQQHAETLQTLVD